MEVESVSIKEAGCACVYTYADRECCRYLLRDSSRECRRGKRWMMNIDQQRLCCGRGRGCVAVGAYG